MNPHWSITNCISLCIFLVSMFNAAFLIKKSLKNFRRNQCQWSKQRLLRFITSIALFFMILSFCILTFSYTLNPDYLKIIKETKCDLTKTLATVTGVAYAILLPFCFVLGTMTTLDRYERLNSLYKTDQSFKALRAFNFYLVGLGIIAQIYGIPFYLRSCYRMYGSWYEGYVASLALLSLTFAVSDTVLNLWMIRQSLSQKHLHNTLFYADSAWGRFLNKMGVKKQLYGYFFVLLFLTVLDISLAVMNAASSRGANDEIVVLTDTITIAFYLPIHIGLTYKLLDLFLALLQNKPKDKKRYDEVYVYETQSKSGQDVQPNSSIDSHEKGLKPSPTPIRHQLQSAPAALETGMAVVRLG